MKSHEKILASIALSVFVFGMIVPMTTLVTQQQSQTRTTNVHFAPSELPSFVVTSTGVSYTYGANTSGSLSNTWSQDGLSHHSSALDYPQSHPNIQKYPASGTDWSIVGYWTWGSPSGITAQGGSYAVISPLYGGGMGVLSHYLRGSNFGLNIPVGAAIDGIYFELYRRNGMSGAIYDNAIYLVKNIGGTPTVVGTNHKSTAAWGSWAWASYGSSSDLWGTTWAYSEINDGAFGAVLQVQTWGNIYSPCSAQVDAFRITVTYHTAYYILDYYYSFQFATAPNECILRLDWGFYGSAGPYSPGGVRIYLYNWITSAWVDTGLTVPFGQGFVSRDQTGVDANSYMDASGNMRIRFCLVGQSSAFYNFVDYLYWFVILDPDSWSITRPQSYQIIDEAIGTLGTCTYGSVSIACHIYDFDPHNNEPGYGDLFMHVAVDAGVLPEYQGSPYYPYYLAAISIQVYECLEKDKTEVWTSEFGAWNLHTGTGGNFESADTVLTIASLIIGVIPITGFPILSALLAAAALVPETLRAYVGPNDNIGTFCEYGTDFYAVFQGTAYQDIQWRVHTGNTGAMGIQIVATAYFTAGPQYPIVWATTSVSLSIS